MGAHLRRKMLAFFTKLLFFILFFELGPCVHVNSSSSSLSRHHQHFLSDESSSEEVFSYRINGNVYNHSNHEVGIFPPLGNLALHAKIQANATCGNRGPETYCKLVEHVPSTSRPLQCNECDQSDRRKRHPVNYAIDGSSKWWQSPTLANGQQYEYVTINIDLSDVYTVAYVIIKSAISPRPGNWILERSLDGVTFHPWQYYAISDEECYSRYRIRAKPGRPTYEADDEVICTSYYSKIDPLEGGEIHTSLVNGRPGASGPSESLINFTMARYIRLRFQKIRTLLGDLMSARGFSPTRFWDKSVMRRYFYSIADISIGGHCVCFGHANKCEEGVGGKPEAKCMCQHNTCGPKCDHCCPLYNQYQWGPGNSTTNAICELCECFGHADSCVYDPRVHEQGTSLNIFGMYSGGGVCIQCKDHTKGINCETCEDFYFRPRGVLQDDPKPCFKCDCTSPGSTGECVKDEHMADLLSKEPGDCICKDGFAGKKCEVCDSGFRGYPKCESCPCRMAGIVNEDCDECICKENVKGAFCNVCKQGYFNLDKSNPAGCTQCFCMGATDLCTSSDYPIIHIRNSSQSWVISDLYGVKSFPGHQLPNGVLVVAHEEVAALGQYYWSDSETFSGKRIDSYGLKFIFKMSWVLGRGDSTGRAFPEYDFIIESSNSMLAFGRHAYEGNNATISVILNENNCFVLPDVDNNIIQSGAQPETRCTRYDLMQALSGIKRVLLRAKFHTNQIESQLHYAYMEKADLNSTLSRESLSSLSEELIARSVEICECPLGFYGSSCESCAYGYRKSTNSKDFWLNECVKCDCSGHSETCTLEGKCLCEKNTTGANCQTCADGFYGDPTNIKSVDNPCKPCACPLQLPSNNFSPTCVLDSDSPFGFTCNKCAKEYIGPNCESCANGYFGNPSDPLDFCKPCDCKMEFEDGKLTNRVCDQLTGECLMCPDKSVTGWNCDECQPGYYRFNGSCRACDCFEIGSQSSTCHQESGQCQCRENFGGRKCNTCLERFGNINEGCPPCNCNAIGSLSPICDKITGQCECRPGVGGVTCSQCLDFFFGLSIDGCKECDCHSDGSDPTSLACDVTSGQCQCLPNVIGRSCDQCSPSHWNIASGGGCELCLCDSQGSENDTCDILTGQCPCKTGIAGLNCDFGNCLEGFYFSEEEGSCKVCDPCFEAGHICDPKTGRCVCPPYTEGATCEKCMIGYWGFSRSGCKPCNCSSGSVSNQCSPVTGKCECQPGFEGNRCQICKFGHFGPNCRSCDCDPAGTAPQYCDVKNEICSCGEQGECLCKDNVIGTKCDRCREGTYGLDMDDPKGCMGCFCFHKSNRCSQGYFKWQRFGMYYSLNLRIVRSPGWIQSHPFDPYVQGPDRCYVYLSLPDRSATKVLSAEIKQLKVVNNLIVIPDKGDKVTIEKDVSFGSPLFWELPQIFLGDKVLSYNGFLRFHASSDRIAPYFPKKVLDSYPLVQIQGNHRLILEHYPLDLASSTPPSPGFTEIKLHEDFWKLKNGPSGGAVTREVMMVALQNLQHILIRGTDTPEFFNATLFNVSLDIAIPSPNMDKSMAHGIEVCQCPPEYNSTSCQNPKLGYYRWYKKDFVTSTVVIDLVGEARKCNCNGRADTCDTETGFCQNCLENTAGPHCEVCAIGHYGTPEIGCLPCPCPSIWNNHAETCFRIPGHHFNQFQCVCKVGYTGNTCQRCDYGYFGKPWEPLGFCQPCRCNAYGSVSDECDELDGQCNCRLGVTGKDCSVCADRHVIIGSTCTSCDDKCTGELLNSIGDLAYHLETRGKFDKDAAAVLIRLAHVQNVTRGFESALDTRDSMGVFLEDLPSYSEGFHMLNVRMRELGKECEDLLKESTGSAEVGQNILKAIYQIERESRSVLNTLYEHFFGRHAFKIDSETARREMEIILDEIRGKGPILWIGAVEEAQAELDLVNLKADQVLNVVSGSTGAGAFRKRVKFIWDRVRDLLGQISRANTKSGEAERILFISADLYKLSKKAIESLENMTMDMDMAEIMTGKFISEGGYLRTEAEQVLLMLEDIMKELRNITKEVEIRDNNLFEFIPLYRVQFAQPAFNHVEMLKEDARYMKRVLDSLRLNGSEPLDALSTYEIIMDGFDKAFEFAQNATRTAKEAKERINLLLEEYSIEKIVNKSTDLMNAGLNLSGVLEETLSYNLNSLRSTLKDLAWKVQFTNESLRNFTLKMDQELDTEAFFRRIEEIYNFVNETSMEIMETESRILLMKKRVDAIKGGMAPNAVDMSIQLETAQEEFAHSEVKAGSVEIEQGQIETKFEDLGSKLARLRALVEKSRHKADNIKVSIGPDPTGTCFRLFKWDIVEDATFIKFNFAPMKSSDSLLFFWPSSISDDFISIEMVNRKINASWDLGSGLRSLVHPKRFNRISENSDDPDIWVEISFQRIGSSVRLNVQTKIDRSIPIEYPNFGEEATILNHGPDDLIHIGGFSKEKRPGLTSNGLSGCIHGLVVNQRSLGLWNFVGNEGCAPCFECPMILAPSIEMLSYYFDGRGYSSMSRIKNKVFNSKFFDISLEFRTYSENALLFLTVNERVGQSISLQIIGGRMVFQMIHDLGQDANDIRIETDGEVNTGEWTEIRAIWFYQRQKQTCQLTVGKRNFKQEKVSPNPLALDLYDAVYHVGGVIPGFDTEKWRGKIGFTPFVGCLKNLLIDSTSYDPVSGFFFGVESPCSGRSSHLISFEGDGFSEFQSKSMGKDFKVGFSFKTTSPSGILIFSAFTGSESEEDPYYGVFLENGQVSAVIGYKDGQVEMRGSEVRYDDGIFHYIRLVKKNRRVVLYINDEEISDIRLPKKFPAITAPKSGGLYIGGVPDLIQKKFPALNIIGFTGCIQNMYFGDEILNFMYPVSSSNQLLDKCTVQSGEFEELNSGRRSFIPRIYSQHVTPSNLNPPADQECFSTKNKLTVKQEERSRAGHFGDTKEPSWALISLDKSRVLRLKFNLTFNFRTFYPDGLFLQGFKKKNGDVHHQCLSAFLKDGQIFIKIYGHGGGRDIDLVSTSTNLNDGEWHSVTLLKTEETLFLYVDVDNVTSISVHKIKPITRLQLGGIPPDGQDCFENSIQKPDYFKGCIKNLMANSHHISLNPSPSVTLHRVQPCFKEVEVGTFFRGESYAIYSYNLTLGSLMELELDFKSDSRNGDLLRFQPASGEYPSFSIFLNDGKLIAREIISREESFEAIQDFSNVKGHVCNGLWHVVKVSYDKGSISLRVDNFDPVFGLDEPLIGSRRSVNSVSNANKILHQQQQVLGSLYIGGNEETSRESKRNQFYGCIRNISINRQRKDWSDFALLSNVFLNACPAT